MDGMGMMLKAIGFDPDEFKQWMGGLQTFAQKVNSDLETIKANQSKIITLLEAQANGRQSGNSD